MKKRTKNGFTLIELIVVIAIIAILITITIPRMNQYRIEALTKARLETAKTLYLAAQAYEIDNKIPEEDLANFRSQYYNDMSTLRLEDNGMFWTTDSLLAPYISGDVKFYYTLTDLGYQSQYANITDRFCVSNFPQFPSPHYDNYIAVYYIDPRMPNPNDLMFGPNANLKFFYSQTALINGVPMVIGARHFYDYYIDEHDIASLVPVEEYLAAYKAENN